jgi:hypothetical protein
MISSSIPYTTLFNKTPDYSFMKILDCFCFSYTRPYNSYKLQLRALPYVFLGYVLSQKGYHCLHVPTNQLYIFRYVTFDESKFSFKDGLFLQAPPDPNASYSPILVLPSWALTSLLLPSQFQPTTSSPAQSTFPSTARNSNTFAPSSSEACPTSSTHYIQTPSPTQLVNPPPEPPLSSSPLQPSHPMTTRTKDNTRRIRHFPDHVVLLASIDSKLTTFAQASLIPEW